MPSRIIPRSTEDSSMLTTSLSLPVYPEFELGEVTNGQGNISPQITRSDPLGFSEQRMTAGERSVQAGRHVALDDVIDELRRQIIK